MSFDLEKGITVGEGESAITHTKCELREANNGDFIDAAKKAASVELAPTGQFRGGFPIMEPISVINPYLMELEVLYRQVVRIGDIKGPLNEAYWRLLSETDIGLIKHYADQMREVPLGPQEVVLGGRKVGHDESGQENG